MNIINLNINIKTLFLFAFQPLYLPTLHRPRGCVSQQSLQPWCYLLTTSWVSWIHSTRRPLESSSSTNTPLLCATCHRCLTRVCHPCWAITVHGWKWWTPQISFQRHHLLNQWAVYDLTWVSSCPCIYSCLCYIFYFCIALTTCAYIPDSNHFQSYYYFV